MLDGDWSSDVCSSDLVPHPRAAEMAPLQRLREQGVPLVTFGTAVPGATALQAIASDTTDLAQVAVRHLLGLGHRRIAYVSYAPPEYPSVSQRERGWRAALREAGVRVGKDWVAYANISAQSGFDATQQLLARGVKFTALFAGNDTIAFGALRALREAGLRVPEDVAVVGYDDIPLAAFASPPLTSVRTDPVGHGRQAVQMLLKQLGRLPPDAALDTAEPPRLVVRESCGSHGSRRAR
jgi:LacI family transcriptional regulator